MKIVVRVMEVRGLVKAEWQTKIEIGDIIEIQLRSK